MLGEIRVVLEHVSGLRCKPLGRRVEVRPDQLFVGRSVFAARAGFACRRWCVEVVCRVFFFVIVLWAVLPETITRTRRIAPQLAFFVRRGDSSVLGTITLVFSCFFLFCRGFCWAFASGDSFVSLSVALAFLWFLVFSKFRLGSKKLSLLSLLSRGGRISDRTDHLVLLRNTPAFATCSSTPSIR